MRLKNEVVEEVKQKFKIDESMKAYMADCNIWETLRAKFDTIEYNAQMRIHNHNSPKEDFKLYDCISHMKGKGFEAVRCEFMGNFETVEMFLVFTKDVDSFYKKHLKGKYIPIPKMKIEKGVFRPRQTMMGWQLDSVPLGQTIKPILNHNLFQLLNKEVEAFLRREDIYKEIGADYKRGIMLYGDAGNGKTTFIKHLLHSRKDAVCVLMNSQADNVLDFMEYFVSVEQVLDDLKIIVIEDIDGMRADNRSNLLNFLDGLHTMNKVIIIATTNFPDKVDVALKERPSRFDSIYKIDVPNANSRKKLLQMYFKGINNSMLDQCIVASKGFSGAFFKEFYIISKLNELDALGAINEVVRRRNMCK